MPKQASHISFRAGMILIRIKSAGGLLGMAHYDFSPTSANTAACRAATPSTEKFAIASLKSR